MFDEEELLACEKSRRTLEVILGPLPVTEHMHCREMLKVLRSIGLDIRGGLEYLIPTYRWVNCTKARSFPMSNILVTDAEKARKFINLGEHIGDDIAEHPSTLLKAAAAFALVSDLVTEKRSCEDLSIALRECQDEMAIWVGKRILFRLQTRERYRQILLDMAREEWLDEQVSLLHLASRPSTNIVLAHGSACKEACQSGRCMKGSESAHGHHEGTAAKSNEKKCNARTTGSHMDDDRRRMIKGQRSSRPADRVIMEHSTTINTDSCITSDQPSMTEHKH
jgi:hypothetical protein